MTSLVYAKFKQNPELLDKLLSTNNRDLIEGNNHGDTFWGVCNGKGNNRLGIILMKVREKLREELQNKEDIS